MPHENHPAEAAMLDRVHALLAGESVREVRMFGAVALMVDDAMAVAVHKDGSLLVRVDPDDDAQLLEDPAATRAEMGAGRSMGAGWIHVDVAGLADDEVLAGWVECATRYVVRRERPGR